MLPDLEYYATQRKKSLFAQDLESHSISLAEAIGGASICVAGAAGSIGRSVLDCLLSFKPRRVALVDLSENNLVELTRDLRSSQMSLPEDLRTLPIDFGSFSFKLFLKNEKPFDYFFNLSAMKHVRSEKDEYCLKRLVETNILNVDDLFNSLAYQPKGVFSVSSDKAVNPSNAMGATKKIMEDVMLAKSETTKVNFARFANVAFSYGSLPYGFLSRIEKKQPLAGPSDIRRYFISHQEAGQLCVLNGIIGENREAYFPMSKDGLPEVSFQDIASRVLDHYGYKALMVDDEEVAKKAMADVAHTKAWPCLFGPSNTDGEKALEEFYTSSEKIVDTEMTNIGVVQCQMTSEQKTKISGRLDWFRAQANQLVGKEKYFETFASLVPGFTHNSHGKNLDEKM